ncbi:MAG: SIMPL domain-containing protein [Granulosicoccus sp.]
MQNKRHWKSLIAFWLIALSTTIAVAQDNASEATSETLYNVFTLAASASAELDNDLMIATLAVQAEDKDAAQLANQVNATMTWAINQLRPFSTIKKKTRDYQTYPRYDSSQARRLIGWHATQTLEIETDDFQAAGKAIQLLQEKLQIQGTQLRAKEKTRQRGSDALISEALSAFKDRALLVQTNMGAPGYRILDITIETDDSSQPQYRSEAMTMRSMDAVSAPAIESGTSRVSVQVHGRIQLK